MAFQQGLSGLNATSKNLSVIGNNIANANTFGAKASRAEFADMYANALGGGSGSPIGIGVNLAAVTQRFSQGNIVTTESGLDLAINGNGFFQLDAGGTTVYSRNGQFQLNNDGNIVNAGGQRLLGYPVTDTGGFNDSKPVPLSFPTKPIPPQVTSRVDIELNLDQRQAAPDSAINPFDPADEASYNNATSVTAYDQWGTPVALTFYFVKSAAAPNTWDVHMTENGVASGTPVIAGLEFDVNGPTATVAPDADIIVNAGLENEFTFHLDLSEATQFGSAFSVTSLDADGYAAGQLAGINIDKNGVIVARYSNGETTSAGKVVLATFKNPQGLQPLGGNGWAQTAASGDAMPNAPGDGNAGVLQSGALEESNIDLTAELVNMITAQRSYQANAQSIKTEDQVLQTLVNLR
jgi:flagellar hook protein FlgE